MHVPNIVLIFRLNLHKRQKAYRFNIHKHDSRSSITKYMKPLWVSVKLKKKKLKVKEA